MIFIFYHHMLINPFLPLNSYRHTLEIFQLVPDHQNKPNIVVKQITQFPSAYKCYVYTIVYNVVY